jgi:hypothetical protein
LKSPCGLVLDEVGVEQQNAALLDAVGVLVGGFLGHGQAGVDDGRLRVVDGAVGDDDLRLGGAAAGFGP